MEYAPLTVFVYNRPEHTKQVLEALNHNDLAEKTDLIVFSDAPKHEGARKGVEEVRQFLSEFKKLAVFRSVSVHEADHNIGCRDSIISGVTKVLEQYEKTIVVEDDLLCRKNFLQYMNEGLEMFESDPRIWSLAGHTREFPALQSCKGDFYLTYRACSWGWAIWKDRWDTIDWSVSDFESFRKDPIKRLRFAKGGGDLYQMLENEMNGKTDAWDLRLQYSMAKTGRFTVYPVHTFVYNIGFDGSGTHCVVTGNEQFDNLDAIPYKLDPGISFDPYVNRGFLNAEYPNLYKRGLRKLKKILKRT